MPTSTPTCSPARSRGIGAWPAGRCRRAVLASDDRGTYARGDGAGRAPHSVAPANAAVEPEQVTEVERATDDELVAVVDRLGALLDVPAATLEAQEADALRSRVQVLRRVEGMTAAAHGRHRRGAVPQRGDP